MEINKNVKKYSWQKPHSSNKTGTSESYHPNKKNDEIKLIIKTTFKIIGAAAAAANLLLEFKIPAKKDDKLTNNKKGKVILVNSTARLNFILSSTNPGAIKKTK